jgi:DNA-binding response OmpR family regulator
MARLLVVEDDADTRDLVALRLLKAGHRVVATADAGQALEALGRLGPADAYLLDVELPGTDGFGLLERLRVTADPDVPAIFLTVRSGAEDRERGRRLGAEYLTKPVSTPRLLAAVDAVVSHGPVALARRRGW